MSFLEFLFTMKFPGEEYIAEILSIVCMFVLRVTFLLNQIKIKIRLTSHCLKNCHHDCIVISSTLCVFVVILLAISVSPHLVGYRRIFLS